VKPSEKFPLDGRIAKGETTANQAPITGESRPVPKAVGDDVYAGTINEDGAVEIVTTRGATDTTLARITRMVGDAQAKRAPSEQWVETFARYYTPAVIVLAILVAAIPPMLFGGAFTYWFYHALVLLVIACPCALVISTPVSIVAALASAARHGVLIKGGLHVERPGRLKAIALDKTGTLTDGQPQVQQVVPLSGHDERELLEIASAIERRSEHPLARAIVRYAESRGLSPPPVDDYQTLKGKGATAHLKGTSVWIGSHRLLEERAQETPDMHAQLETLSAAGSSIVVVGNDDHVCGFIAIGDRVRDGARRAVAALRAAGIEHVIMLTGDNHGTARAVAEATGLDEVRAELSPEQKVAAIEELVARYGAVAMVGDGVNDAPALARSSLGIAMGVAGTDAALETADVALMSDDLSRLPWLIRHSRRTLAIIRQNIVAALAVKAVFILLTLAGHASLWAAIAADTGMSLVVVFNALRLLNGRAALRRPSVEK
jgi:Cd2+/Zn2+-exporting ATPase